MPAPLSVIVPVLNAERDLPACLASLVEGAEAGLLREVVVSGTSTCEGARAMADEAGAAWVEGERGRGRQLRRGAEAARGDWLLFLHADTVLETGWSSAAATHMASRADKAAVFRLAFRSGGWRAHVVAGLANLRSRWLALPYGDQGLLVPRTLYDATGGYEPIPLMEDVSLVRRIGRSRLAVLDARAFTSSARQVRDGWFARSARNIILVTRYFAGADPEDLARAYYRK